MRYAVHIYFMGEHEGENVSVCVYVKIQHYKRKDLRNIIKSIKYKPHIRHTVSSYTHIIRGLSL